MAIHVDCHLCGRELTHSGALLFSPPDILDRVKKFHLCGTCYNKTMEALPQSSRGVG
jgi:hypothetical protein